jgi:hypothetical protein
LERASLCGVGMEESSPPATCHVLEDHRHTTQETTNNAIQAIEDFITNSNPTELVNNVWEWVKNALAGAKEPGVDQSKQDTSGISSQAQDIADIKTGLRELSRTVQGLTKQLGPRPATYSQVLGQATGDTATGATRATRAAKATKATRALIFPALGNTKHTKPVPPVHARQLIINPGNESESQRNYTGEELVNDINIVLGIKDVTRAYRFPSRSALITLLGMEEKAKWETQTEILKAFREGTKV